MYHVPSLLSAVCYVLSVAAYLVKGFAARMRRNAALIATLIGQCNVDFSGCNVEYDVLIGQCNIESVPERF